MAKESTLTRNSGVESLRALGQFCLSSIRGVALMAGGIGGLVIVGIWLLVLVFPIFLFVSFLFKLLGL